MKELRGFEITLDTCLVTIVFNQPILVPDDFKYKINLSACAMRQPTVHEIKPPCER